MRLVLEIYSDKGYQEFILPNEENSNYSVVLDNNIFGLHAETVLQFDVVKGAWRFVGHSDNCVLADSNTILGQTICDGSVIGFRVDYEQISVSVLRFEADLGEFDKFRVTSPSKIMIGTEASNDVILSDNPLISRHHATLSVENGICTLVDSSINGTYVNGHRIEGAVSLRYGDCVALFGVQIVWLGDYIAFGCKTGHIKCDLPILEPVNDYGPRDNIASGKRARKYFRRSPRNMPKIISDTIEIEGPPQPQITEKRPLLLAIGPSLTMAIPMLLGTGVAILGSRAGGSSASAYMYTGIIIAVMSALIGAMWAIINLNYSKKQERSHEVIRQEKYKEYLERVEKEISEKYTTNSQSLGFLYPSAARCCAISGESPALWTRNKGQEDFLFLRLGTGSIPFQCRITVPQDRFTLVEDQLANMPREIAKKYKYLKKVPVGIDLENKRLIGIVACDRDDAMKVVRNVVVQAAANICYTDLKLVFLFDGSSPSDRHAWSFGRWLPHTWSADRRMRYFAANESERSEVCYGLAGILRERAEQLDDSRGHSFEPHYLVFVSSPDLLEGEPVSKYLLSSDDDLGVTTFLIAQRFEQLPNRCVDIIMNDAAFTGIMNTELGEGSKTKISFDETAADEVSSFARNITGVEVRENEAGGEIPNSLEFLEMYGVGNVEELKANERWLKNRTYENMRVPIGQKNGGAILNLDIHEKYHGPHGLVAGTTGSGKSETLQTYILSLAVNFSPDDVAFFLIDFKGGGMSNLFAKLPHTAGTISNLSGNQINRAMVSIKSENMRRQKIFGNYGVNHIDQYTKLFKNGEAETPIPHLFVVIDEFAELKRNEPEFMRELISVAQVGRSLGVHLILATQKPSGTVDDNIWSNTRFRLCLRVQDRQDSTDVLHRPDAAYLTNAGRCYLQVGNDEIYELFQSGWSGAVYDVDSYYGKTSIASLYSNTGRAAAVSGGNKAKRLEHKKTEWLRTLLRVAGDALSKSYESPKAYLHQIFDKLKSLGYDYAETPVNSQRLADFLSVCARYKNYSDEETVRLVVNEFQSSGRVLPEARDKTQLDAVVDYLADVYKKTGREKTFALWKPVLPQNIYLFDLSNYKMYDGEKWPTHRGDPTLSTIVGEYDDPANQNQQPLIVDFSANGNLAICGSILSGKSTLLQTILFGLINKYSPEELNIYALDYSNHMLAPFAGLSHVGGVLFDNEPEKAEKLFVLINKIVEDRKKRFQGGSYAQYVKVNGTVVPYIIIAVDNYTSFREKTENRFESELISLTREGSNYGIYFIITSGGFGASEIQNRVAENLRQVLCLEMGDKFKYSDVLRASHFDVYPETNIKGRGLANVEGRFLEFQTALSVKAEDDYDRAEKLRVCFAEMERTWAGSRARKIPVIPEEPEWEDLKAAIYETEQSTADRLYLGWNTRDASVAAIELSKTYCWLISGKARTGKTNLLKTLVMSAAMLKSRRYIIELNGKKLAKFAQATDTEYIPDASAMFGLFKSLIPTFRERNQLKQGLLEDGLDDADVYSRIRECEPIFIFIDDLGELVKAAYTPPEGVGTAYGFLENITEKGFLHNIYFFATIDLATTPALSGKKVFTNMTSYRAGIHLGGNVNAQRVFDFSSLPYSEQNKASGIGTGLIAPNEYNSAIQEVAIPITRG